ncbi:MAG: DUF3853 family protein [Muribaculaceae bacterium]|nr:DUF3853 family protein [Muribaculaceae bacterium]
MGKENIRGVKGLAEILGIHRATVYRWISSGILDDTVVCHIGRVKIFDLQKVYEAISPENLTNKK